ncbi:hypothetical protein DID80_01430 [Candidatus Marinamargulisbacteria bacterium SCGC AAA071-K20]|nr:hypothetical protein DID80_01430 [Candidatus Marinamargulisbacteria bacterium SCGC AAA071-K20]
MTQLIDSLPRHSQSLLRKLVYHWLPGLDTYMPSYGDLSPMDPRNVPGLEHLNEWIKANDLPLITAIIVIKKSKRPSSDFFNAFYTGVPGREKTLFWKESVKAVRAFDWTTIIDAPTFLVGGKK